MLKAPMIPRASAAWVAKNPCSVACGMRWVRTRPELVYPHTQKLPARSQNGAVPAASRRLVRSAVCWATVTGTAPSPAPNGRRPMSRGSFRMSPRIRGSIPARNATPMTTKATRHPQLSVSHMARGTMRSCPAAIPPPVIPSTRPRRASNQRAAKAAATAVEAPPAPMATTTPTVT